MRSRLYESWGIHACRDTWPSMAIGRNYMNLEGGHACLDTWPSMAFGRYAALTTRPDLMHAVQA
jgi:hypothetical protein